MTGFELIGGPEPGPVTLVDYDPAWPALYEARKRELAGRDWAARQDHADAKGPLIDEIAARG